MELVILTLVFFFSQTAVVAVREGRHCWSIRQRGPTDVVVGPRRSLDREVVLRIYACTAVTQHVHGFNVEVSRQPLRRPDASPREGFRRPVGESIRPGKEPPVILLVQY